MPVDGVILAMRKQAGSEPSLAGCFASHPCSEASRHCRWHCQGTSPLPPAPAGSRSLRTSHSPPAHCCWIPVGAMHTSSSPTPDLRLGVLLTHGHAMTSLQSKPGVAKFLLVYPGPPEAKRQDAMDRVKRDTGLHGIDEDVLREAEDQATLAERLGENCPPTSVGTYRTPTQHAACEEDEEEEGGLAKCEEEGLFSHAHCTATQTIPSAAAIARSEGQNWCTADSLCVLLLLHIPSKPGLDSACWIQIPPNLPLRGTSPFTILDSAIILEMGLESERYIYRSIFYLHQIMVKHCTKPMGSTYVCMCVSVSEQERE